MDIETVRKCPKCNSKSAWLEAEGQDLVQRCLCGLNKYLFRVSAEGEIEPIEPRNIADSIKMPLENPNHYKCLLAIYKTYPDPVQTAQVAAHCGFENKPTYGFIASLLSKGLVERVEERKGLPGGSSWTLTEFGQGQLDSHFHMEDMKASEKENYIPDYWQ